MSVATFRRWRYVALAIIIILAIQARWSVIKGISVPQRFTGAGQPHDRQTPVAPSKSDQTLESHRAHISHSHQPHRVAHADHARESSRGPDPDDVVAMDRDPEIHRILSSLRAQKPDDSLHLELQKSTWHFKQIKPVEADLDAMRRQDPHHYPPWNDYRKSDYDPNRWHFFPLEERLYQCTIYDSPISPGNKSILYQPKTIEGPFTSCYGPRGVRLNESNADAVFAYNKTCKNFPRPLFGSYDAMGLDGSVCFTRSSRYGGYGLGTKSDRASILIPNAPEDDVDWNRVGWGTLQNECYAANKYALAASTAKNRTAILVRSWEGYHYETNDLHMLRSLVSETALHSHGEYQVYLFVQVKNTSLPIFQDRDLYKETLESLVPAEFRDMTILWNEEVVQDMYSKVGNSSVYWQVWQSVQWFSLHHSEFEYIWNWEMDSRYIGHHFHLLDTVSNWTTRQPRKYLWERSSRLFMPSIHQSWHKFFNWVSVVVPTATSIWGPRPAIDTASRLNYRVPPGPVGDDNFEYGVGEPADLISFLPFFDPENTLWAYKDIIYNYIQGRTTPRRVYINTQSRLSRRLLMAMHEENKAGLSMVSEMWPATVALHFGMKAVHAPHPIWTSHIWPLNYANEVFNIGPASAPASDYDAPYSPDREHYFGNVGFYFWSHLPGTLYRRWLGWNVVDENGMVADWESKGEGEKMCLPAMLLHPVKKADFEQRGEYRP